MCSPDLEAHPASSHHATPEAVPDGSGPSIPWHSNDGVPQGRVVAGKHQIQPFPAIMETAADCHPRRTPTGPGSTADPIQPPDESLPLT